MLNNFRREGGVFITKKWRLLTTTTDISEFISGYIPALLRAIAEKKIRETVVLYYIDKPSVFLQRYCDVLRDINYEACIENNVVISRGIITAGGVLYGEPGTEPLITMGWYGEDHPELPTQPDLILMKILGAAADVISEKYKIPVRYRPMNDMEAWDPKLKAWRKIVGSGASGLFGALGFGIWVQATKPSDLLAKVMVSPAEKYADKVLKDITTRGWNLEEAGVYRLGLKEIERIREDWKEIYLEAIKKAFNVEVEEEDFTDIELQYVEEFKKQFYSEEWIFARSAEKRYEEIPPGTRLGKAFLKISGGPLIRAYVLREGDKIREMMFTGTVQMLPPDALEKLEKELAGVKIDEAAIRTKVQEWFKTGVQIGMLEPPQLANLIIEACKLSYEE